MKTIVPLLALLSSSLVFAADASLSLGVVHNPSSGNLVHGELSRDFAVSSDASFGIGVEYRRSLSSAISLELSASWSESELEFTSPEEEDQSLGELRAIPVRALLVAQAPLGRFSPFVGAGVSYTLLELTDRDLLDDRGTGDLDIEDELTWVAKGGVDMALTQAHAITASATYEPLGTRFTATDREPLSVEFDELSFFVGVRSRF